MAPQEINWAIYYSLPQEQAQYQLAHIHESKKAEVARSYSICLPIALFAIIMRFVSRRIGRTTYGADDWVIVVALIITLACASSALLATFRYGGGRHTILMTETDPMNFAKSVLASEVLYGPAMGAVKISTLLLFARIFPDRNFRRILWAIGVFVSAYTVAMVFTGVFQCSPIKGAWDTSVEAKCIQIKLVWMVTGGLNVLTDILLLWAPLPQLWKLQMPRATKLQLISIFSVGSFVTVISIYRIPKLQGLSFLDPAWGDAESSIWSFVEVSVAILCASAITYRPLFNWIFHVRHFSLDFKIKVSKSDVARSPHSDSTPTGMEPSKIDDVEMQPPRPLSNHSQSQVLENRERFYRIDDLVSM